MLWATITLSCVLGFSAWPPRLVLLLIGAAVTIHILKLRTLNKSNPL